MPYIKDRAELDDHMKRLYQHIKVGGDLNYVISKLCNDILGHRARKRNPDDPKLSYADINELIGALECAKLELYRRMAAPYEDTKIKENGDVYHNPTVRE
jgi:hypothetical protein